VVQVYERMVNPTRVSRNQLQVWLKARMLKNRVIYEGVPTGLYIARGARGWRGRQREMIAGAHWLPACTRW
jgi:hypothetical protein